MCPYTVTPRFHPTPSTPVGMTMRARSYGWHRPSVSMVPTKASSSLPVAMSPKSRNSLLRVSDWNFAELARMSFRTANDIRPPTALLCGTIRP